AENRTFYNDERLPSLPVPTVEQTIEKYLDSCRAILSDEEYSKTYEICQKFKKQDAPKLQEKLLERSKSHKNWLEQWWLENAYLEGRTPLPVGNFSGPGTYVENYWPLKEGTQLERAALGLYILLQFWQLVRKEMIAVHTLADGTKLTMHQFRYLFNTCRVPHRDKDELSHSFKTEAEGSSPTHIVVLCRGYFFKIISADPVTGDICSPAQLFAMFKDIRDICHRRKEKGIPVASLTAMDRDSWADARDHLIEISSKNEEILKAIETSLIITTLDDTSPGDYTELTYEGMCGDPGQRWYDKSYNSSTMTNGSNLCLCDHTPFDAMVMVALYDKPEELVFQLDDSSMKSINEATKFCNGIKENLELLQIVFEKFGKSALKKYKVHPDFFVQICLQLAYMMTHGKPGSTYETATTRQFYHGRTETCRSCTPEAVEFCRAMMSNTRSKDLKNLFFKAHHKFVSLM
uniref:Choline/carnitine acyltransferase domain-containing protein n=1 Tax=Ciona savignyi TaxID=51511 RepID=H2ZAP8_CIOSA